MVHVNNEKDKEKEKGGYEKYDDDDDDDDVGNDNDKAKEKNRDEKNGDEEEKGKEKVKCGNEKYDAKGKAKDDEEYDDDVDDDDEKDLNCSKLRHAWIKERFGQDKRNFDKMQFGFVRIFGDKPCHDVDLSNMGPYMGDPIGFGDDMMMLYKGGGYDFHLKDWYGKILSSASFSDKEKKAWLLKKIGKNNSFESLQSKFYKLFGREEHADFSQLGPYTYKAQSLSDDIIELHKTGQFFGDIEPHEVKVVVEHWTTRIRDTIAYRNERRQLLSLRHTREGSDVTGKGQGSVGTDQGQGSVGTGGHGQGSVGTGQGQGSVGTGQGQGSVGTGGHGQGSVGTDQGQGSVGTGGHGQGSVGTGQGQVSAAAGSIRTDRQEWFTGLLGVCPDGQTLNENLHNVLGYEDLCKFDKLGPYNGDPDSFCEDLLLIYEGNREIDWLLKQWCEKIKASIIRLSNVSSSDVQDKTDTNKGSVKCSTKCLGMCSSATDGNCMFLSNALMDTMKDEWSENQLEDFKDFHRNPEVIVTRANEVFVPLAIDRNLERNNQSRTQWVNTSHLEWIYWSRVGLDLMTWDKGESMKRLVVGQFYKAKESSFGEGLCMILKILRGKCKDSKIGLLAAYYVPFKGWEIRYEKTPESHIDWLKENSATEYFAPTELVNSLLKSYHDQSNAVFVVFDKWGGFDEKNPRYKLFRNGHEVSLNNVQVQNLLEESFPEEAKDRRGDVLNLDDLRRVCVLPPFEYMATQCQQQLLHQKHNQALNVDSDEGKYSLTCCHILNKNRYVLTCICFSHTF